MRTFGISLKILIWMSIQSFTSIEILAKVHSLYWRDNIGSFLRVGVEGAVKLMTIMKVSGTNTKKNIAEISKCSLYLIRQIWHLSTFSSYSKS